MSDENDKITFFQKYWKYIIAIIIFLLSSILIIFRKTILGLIGFNKSNKSNSEKNTSEDSE